MGSEGLLLSGGSLANQTAVVCARELRGLDAARGVAYLSQRAHHSLHKALHLSGVPRRCVHDVPTAAGTRIDVAALRAQIEHDRAAGRVPWLVVGTAGSTDTGAVDDLRTLADVAVAHGAWFHVDAAYGGMFMLTARGRERLAGIERADSVTVDAHKGLALPYGVAALLVREPGALARAHAADEGHYLRDVPRGPAQLPHYFERGPELTRPFRGLLAWLPLQLHGVAAFRDALDTALDLARYAAEALRAIDGIDVLETPELSIVAFAARAGDAATERVVEAINGSGRFKVSSTQLDGRTMVRLAILNPRTRREQIDGVLALIRDAAR
jgi:aromatic-L-amino-acid decarboxylase